MPRRPRFVCEGEPNINNSRGDIIKTGDISKILSMSRKATWKEYLNYNDQTINEVIRSKTLKGVVLGNEKFISALEQKTGIMLKEKQPGRPRKLGAVP